MYVFAGPSPDYVISQYTDVIGKPFLPPYWSLGFHLCRYGYTGTDELKKVIERNRAIGIPYVSICSYCQLNLIKRLFLNCLKSMSVLMLRAVHFMSLCFWMEIMFKSPSVFVSCALWIINAYNLKILYSPIHTGGTMDRY